MPLTSISFQLLQKLKFIKSEHIIITSNRFGHSVNTRDAHSLTALGGELRGY